MKDVVVPVMVGVVTFLIVAVAFIVIRGDPTAKSPTTSGAVSPGPNLVESGFNPVPNDSVPFRATLAINTSDTDDPIDAKILYDGDGTLRFEAKDAESVAEYYLTPTGTIICEIGQCYRVENDPTDPFFNIDTFTYSAGDLDGFKGALRFDADQPCGDTVCEQWIAADPESPVSRVLLEKGSRRVIELDGGEEESTLNISFDYTETTVVLPLNIITVPSE